jgi:D-3-phosphoglycerate dehydrogenase
LSEEAYKVIEPYIDLANRMGKFAGQLIKGRIEEARITYNGAMTTQKVAPITFSLVHGLLYPILGETVNSINAMDLADERGINVQEIQSNKEEEFVNLVSLEIKTDKETFSLWGTLSANNQPRIVKIDKIYVEAIPDGNMLFINNNDRPGIVGAVGTILAQGNVNIGSISFGREKQGGIVISVVNVDSEIPEAVLEKLRQTKDILFVKQIKV